MQTSAFLANVSSADIDLVRSDVRLMGGLDEKGERRIKPIALHYCVDAKEIIDFCFPLNAYGHKEIDLDRIAAEQAALYELFYRPNNPPVLLPQYMMELHRFYTFAAKTAEASIEERIMVKRLIEAAPENELQSVGEGIHSVLDKVEHGFQRKLAVWMGIYSIGLHRFESVLRTKLRKPTDLGLPFIDSFLDSYEPSLMDQIYKDQETSLRGREQDPQLLRSRLNAALTDASVVDWVLALNRVASEAAPGDAEQHVFLYVSSAPKSERIFAHSEVRSAFPVVNGRHYPLLRNRDHFHLLAMAFRNAAADDYGRVIENLNEIERTFRNTGHLESAGSDSMSSLVNELGKSIREQAESISDLSFLARLSAYKDLTSAKPSSQEQKEYVQYLRDIFKREDIPSAAMQRITYLQELTKTQTIIAQHGLLEPSEQSASMSNMYGNLPASRPFLADEFGGFEGKYDELAQEIFSYHKLPTSLIQPRSVLLGNITYLFEQLDKETQLSTPAGTKSSELELLRCIIYLSFAGNAGDEDALDLATEMRQMQRGREKEFLQIICLANLGLAKYWDSYDRSTEGTSDYPTEWFFYHARALAIYSSYKGGLSKGTLKEAVRDLEEAFALVEHECSRPAALIANNLAYFLSENPSSPAYNLDRALSYLNLLEEQFPPAKWGELASFFHTKATVLHQAFLRDGKAGHLQSAGEALERALAIDERCEIYIDLQRQMTPLLKKRRRKAIS
jgi:hypothetical protein